MAAEPAGRGPAPEAPGGPRSGDAPRGATVRELLYVVGHHRSGGTALGALLAAAPSTFFAGELYRFPHPIWTTGDARRGCSCGAPVLTCPFWNDVRRRAEAEGLLERLRRGQQAFERWRGLPRTLFASAARRRGLREHAAAMIRFLEIVAECSGAEVVVEYGPSAARARVYRTAATLGLNVRFVHMVRDGRGFLLSERSTGPDPEAPGEWVHHPLVVIGRWAGMNLAAILLCGPKPSRYLRIRYEELLRDPRGVLGTVGRFGGLDVSEVAERAESGTAIPMRHLAAGNRHRLNGAIVLDRRPPPGAPLPWTERALFWATAGWVAGLLGYRPRATYRRPT